MAYSARYVYIVASSLLAWCAAAKSNTSTDQGRVLKNNDDIVLMGSTVQELGIAGGKSSKPNQGSKSSKPKSSKKKKKCTSGSCPLNESCDLHDGCVQVICCCCRFCFLCLTRIAYDILYSVVLASVKVMKCSCLVSLSSTKTMITTMLFMTGKSFAQSTLIAHSVC